MGWDDESGMSEIPSLILITFAPYLKIPAID